MRLIEFGFLVSDNYGYHYKFLCENDAQAIALANRLSDLLDEFCSDHNIAGSCSGKSIPNPPKGGPEKLED